MEGVDVKVYIEDIQAGQEVSSPFLIGDLRLGQTRNGKPFVGLTLKDRTGSMEGRVWDRAEDFFHAFTGGDVAWIEGVADSFQNKTQLKVTGAYTMDPEQIDLADFLPASPLDPVEMFQELLELVESMTNPHLRGLVLDILLDDSLAGPLKKAPAAKRFHHAYVGGLLEHTLSVTRSADAVAALYPFLDRDLLISGAVLHDLGKIREFDQGPNGDYTDEGRLLGHLIIGLEIVEEKLALQPDFPVELQMLLKHLIVSHHGEYEMGSPKRPKILEALALHHIDDLDAKMNGIGGFIDRHLDEKTGWTDYNRLMGRYFYRPTRRDWPEELPEDQVGELPASPGETDTTELDTRLADTTTSGPGEEKPGRVPEKTPAPTIRNSEPKEEAPASKSPEKKSDRQLSFLEE